MSEPGSELVTGSVLEPHRHPEQPEAPAVGLRTFSGKRVIAVVSVVVAFTLGLNVVTAQRNETTAKTRAVDASVMNDPTRTVQIWKMLPDGMIATFTSVDDDSEPVKRIRRNLGFQRAEYLRANYSDPRFGNRQIAGRAVLEFGTANKELNCRYRDVPGGGELRWITNDSIMLDSLREWATVVSSSSVG